MVPELRAAAARLAAAGVDSPRVDAELLLAHALGRSRTALQLVDALKPDDAERFDALVTRRVAGEPVQHLTGRAPFRHLELAVGPGVFIPRPETESLVELAASTLARATTVLDLCAGSGAIALSIAQEHPSARVIAVELSDEALVWLRRNAAVQAASGDRPVQIRAGDVADAEVLADLVGRVDVVLSNPPYVPATLRHELAPEIAHDPDVAVFAGSDGLALMPAVIAAAERALVPGGLLVVEHDESQHESLPALLADGWRDVEDHRDLTGRWRFVSARRAGP